MGQIAGCERNVPVSVKESHRLLSLSIMTCFLEFCTEILFEHLQRPCNGTTTSNRRKQDIIPGRTMEMPVISPLTLLCLPHDSAGMCARTHTHTTGDVRGINSSRRGGTKKKKRWYDRRRGISTRGREFHAQKILLSSFSLTILDRE